MTIDEGYIKYDSQWTKGPAVEEGLAAELERCRAPLYKAGLVGEYAELGIGFGNISKRCPGDNRFVITATQTGNLPRTTADHYALVTAFDIERNSVTSEGPLQASSEAMTHAAIYALDENIGAIVHVHSKPAWCRYLNELPTTSPNIAYGTPAMAREFARLYVETDFSRDGVAVMAGHEEGLISIGASLDEASARIMALDIT
ncbi:MAG: class II aldolase/adducin family protein [Gammaproteobacteria bacterium]|nr:class II aldolase/adducin family protein [Gammaproteobacteria bacterium]